MKKLVLLTLCIVLLLTGCGQAAAPEVDTVPAIVQEETIPTTDTQDVPTGIAEVAVEPTISEIPAQSQHAPVVAPLEEPAITVLAEPPTTSCSSPFAFLAFSPVVAHDVYSLPLKV